MESAPISDGPEPENIQGFDVREFYVKLAEDLKRRGY